MRLMARIGSWAIFLVLSLVLGCSDGSDRPPPTDEEYQPIENPSVENPPDIGGIHLPSVNYPLSSVGYQEREYFLSGSAAAFVNLNELGSDGFWEVEPESRADYKTRIVVYRPVEPADFSGTVIVEWLNVSAGFEVAPSWIAGHTQMLRAGHVWVGVSAQFVGIEGSESALLPLHLKGINPERYGSLLHPGDSYSYDMFSQVAQALRHPGNIDVLEGLQPDLILADGESQSAGRMVTYINAVQPLYNAFDGYMVHSRGGSSSALAQEPLQPIPTPHGTKIRTDLNVPVMNFQTETDVLLLDSLSSRQADSNNFRLWEVAGTAHADYYFSVSGLSDDGSDPIFAVMVEDNKVANGILVCEFPLNTGPQPWVFNAALEALVDWAGNGTAPANAERLALSDDSSSFVFDEYGNVLAGIRTPYVDTPAAVLSGEGQQGLSFCGLFGTTELFDAATMASLYVDKNGYMQQVAEAADQAVDAGFLLPADADRIKAAAALQWDMLEL